MLPVLHLPCERLHVLSLHTGVKKATRSQTKDDEDTLPGIKKRSIAASDATAAAEAAAAEAAAAAAEAAEAAAAAAAAAAKAVTAAAAAAAVRRAVFVPIEDDLIRNSDVNNKVAAAVALYSWRWDGILSEMVKNGTGGNAAKCVDVHPSDFDGLAFGAAMFIDLETFIQRVIRPKNIKISVHRAPPMNVAFYINDLCVKALSESEADDGSTRCESWKIGVFTNAPLDKTQYEIIMNVVLEGLRDVCNAPPDDLVTSTLFDGIANDVLRNIYKAFVPFDSIPKRDDGDDGGDDDDGHISTICQDTLPNYVFSGSEFVHRPDYAKSFVSTSRSFGATESFASTSVKIPQVGLVTTWVRTDAFWLDANVPVVDLLLFFEENPKWACWQTECEILLFPGCVFELDDQPVNSHFDRTEIDGEDEGLYVQDVIERKTQNMDVYRVYAPLDFPPESTR